MSNTIYESRGNVVTILAGGMEYVGVLVSVEGTKVKLKDPRLVIVQQEGMGFANGVVATGIESPSEVEFLLCTLITETNEQVVSAYKQHVSGLIVPPEPKLKV